MPEPAHESLPILVEAIESEASEIRIVQQRWDVVGRVGSARVTAGFGHGHSMRCSMVVIEAEPGPIIAKYAFHFFDKDKRTVFRYDNSFRHPDVPTTRITSTSARMRR